MSVKDFYNAVTPGSSLTHGVGRGVYTILGKDELCSSNTYENEKLPLERDGKPSLLNEVKFLQCLFLKYIAAITRYSLIKEINFFEYTNIGLIFLYYKETNSFIF